jgi:RNA 3'-terminal phosphate cyclase
MARKALTDIEYPDLLNAQIFHLFGDALKKVKLHILSRGSVPEGYGAVLAFVIAP